MIHSDHALLLILALPFVGSVLAAFVPAGRRNVAALLAGGFTLAVIGLLVSQLKRIRSEGLVQVRLPWVPDSGMDFIVRLDGFAWMFASMVAVIGLLVVIYARYYLARKDPVARFYAFLLAFMGAMIGVAVSGQVIQLSFFWELTGLSSFLLIGYWHHRDDARRGARVALFVTGAGGLCMLVGLMLLGSIVGHYDLDSILASGDLIRNHPQYPVVVVLVALGALTKSAQFPFHFWLPRAMAAPTPVSAYLHSATMVKAGVFLLARFWPVLSGTDLWFWLIGGAGLITLLVGGLFAIFQNDMKGLLAYSTISNLGLITLLLGMNSQLATVAAVFHIMNHAAFKASLFMAVGIVDHECGTRDIRRLSGLRHAMPHTTLLALVSTAAMAGVPLLNGFLSKEMFLAETVFKSQYPLVNVALPVLATIGAACAVAYSLRFALGVFFGPLATNLPREPHEPSRWMRVPIEFLVIVCVLVGVAPRMMVGLLLETAAGPVAGPNLPHYKLAIWHGLNAPLLMSVAAMALGTVAYLRVRHRERSGRGWPSWTSATDGQKSFERLLLGLTSGARQLSRLMSSQRLQPQMLIIIVVAIIAGALAFDGQALASGDRPRHPASVSFVLLWTVGAGCAIGAAWQAKFHRLAALVLLGGTGVVVCLTFVMFAAPDLALTQLAVEVVTTVLFLLGLRWLPKRLQDVRVRQTARARWRRVRDVTVSVIAGLVMAVLSYAFMTRSAPQSISPFYLAEALPAGGGTNVVNVILVDFRAFDTFGEIVVLCAVALTVFALLRRFRPPVEAVQATPQQRRAGALARSDLHHVRSDSLLPGGYLTGPSILAGILFPVGLLISVHLFMRGHNQPGGGFVAGLVVAIALIVQYMMLGARAIEARVTLVPVRWMGIGVLAAVLTGLGSLVVGHPFMTTHTFHATLPLLGEMHLPTALFFDVGVFSVVVGSTVLILLAIAHQSVRVHRRSDEPRVSAREPVQRQGQPAESPGQTDRNGEN